MGEFLHGAWMVCLYYLVTASAALVMRKLIRIPNELFRKILHFILLFSYLPFTLPFTAWWKSVLLTIVLEVLIYPILALCERLPLFSAFITERKAGEFKSSLVLAFTVLAVCNAVCWGWLGNKHFGLACMYAWGVGDAFAALVGKRFGKHKIKWKYADGKKSVEGSAAMFIASALAVVCVLVFCEELPVPAYFIIPIVGAAAATVVEMISKGGMDTIYCPAASMAVMIPLMALFGGFA